MTKKRGCGMVLGHLVSRWVEAVLREEKAYGLEEPRPEQVFERGVYSKTTSWGLPDGMWGKGGYDVHEKNGGNGGLKKSQKKRVLGRSDRSGCEKEV